MLKKIIISLQSLTMAAVLMVSMSASAHTYQVNMIDADIQELVMFVADATQKTFLIEAPTDTKVNVVSEKELTEQELYDLFVSVLNMNGLTAIDEGDTVRVIEWINEA